VAVTKASGLVADDSPSPTVEHSRLTAETFAQLVRGTKRSGPGFTAHCPAHDDQHASLSFGDGVRGLVVKCHAGCRADAVAQSVGLRLSDLFHTHREDPDRTVIRYEIRNPAGALVAVHIRTDQGRSKTFRWEAPDGSSGLGGTKVVDLPLYRSECLHEAAPGEPVVIAEGEKAADALAARDFISVGTVTGAASTPSEEALCPLRDRSVVLWPDNDNIGQGHMGRIARVLQRQGHVDIRQVEWHSARSHDDAFDFFACGGSVEEARRLIAAARPVAEPPPNDTNNGAILIRLADVEPEAIAWLWPGRLARGKLTLLTGDPGVGKSFIALDASARVSRGAAWPDETQAPLGDVLLLSAEDGIADTIRPRVEALGGDLARIHVLRAIRRQDTEAEFSLSSDLPDLERAITETQAILIVIDPLSAYLGDRDSYKDAEVRSLLAPLAALAHRTGVSVLGVMHVGKGDQRRAIHRTLGSVAFVAAARIVLAVGKHPEDDTRRLVVSVKSNLGPVSPALAYRVDDGRLVWEKSPISGLDADAVLGASALTEDRQERLDAANFLREFLEDGPVRAKEVLKAARENGISERTLYRAKSRLGVRSSHTGSPGEPGPWYWSLPMTATPGLEPATRADVAVFSKPSEQSRGPVHRSPEAANAAPVAVFDDVGADVQGRPKAWRLWPDEVPDLGIHTTGALDHRCPRPMRPMRRVHLRPVRCHPAVLTLRTIAS
jgi:putative DNA primase/helicase